MTAVEWLIEEYFGSIKNCTPNFRKHIEQAKQMEKQQIINAWENGYREFYDGSSTPEEYYNKTFKNTNK